MITPIPKLAEPVVCFEPANAFYGDRLEISEEEEFIGPNYSSEPYVLVGADGQAWRIHEFWGPPKPAKTFGGKVLLWIAGVRMPPTLERRDVTVLQLSLEEFKLEVCRRIPLHPEGVFNEELLVGEGLPRGADLELLTAALIERVCADVQATTSIAEAMDALLFAQRDQYDWAEEFHHRPPA